MPKHLAVGSSWRGNCDPLPLWYTIVLNGSSCVVRGAKSVAADLELRLLEIRLSSVRCGASRAAIASLLGTARSSRDVARQG